MTTYEVLDLDTDTIRAVFHTRAEALRYLRAGRVRAFHLIKDIDGHKQIEWRCEPSAHEREVYGTTD
jgi:hypothetical protein